VIRAKADGAARPTVLACKFLTTPRCFVS